MRADAGRRQGQGHSGRNDVGSPEGRFQVFAGEGRGLERTLQQEGPRPAGVGGVVFCVLNGVHSRRFVMVLKRVRYAPKLVLTERCAKREALRVYQEDGAGNRQARLPLIFRIMLSILESAGCFRLKTGHVP